MKRRMFVLSLISIMTPFFRVGASSDAIGRLPVRFRDPAAARQLASQLSAKVIESLPVIPPNGDLEVCHRRDIEQGDVIVVDGWIISRAEAAACVRLSPIEGSGIAVRS